MELSAHQEAENPFTNMAHTRYAYMHLRTSKRKNKVGIVIVYLTKPWICCKRMPKRLRKPSFHTANLFNLEVDSVFYDTTTHPLRPIIRRSGPSNYCFPVLQALFACDQVRPHSNRPGTIDLAEVDLTEWV